jgi:ABC-type antimicrobial peptide transport system permease subunit
MVARHGMRIAIAGIGAGAAASLLFTRLMTSMIYDLPTSDPVTLLAVALTLGSTAFLACCNPAYRAATLDPLIALRDG